MHIVKCIPENTMRLPNASSMMAHRLRRQPDKLIILPMWAGEIIPVATSRYF